LILRRLARPPLFSQDLNQEMVELLEYLPLSMGVLKKKLLNLCNSLFISLEA